MFTSEIPTLETLAFVQAHAPLPPARILEVGCGRGELALHLQKKGYQVVAIDSSVEAVVRAKELGLDARVAQWPNFEEVPFDVVLFTRSLHHVTLLDQAVVQAGRMLKSHGKLIVEDFAVDRMQPMAAEWLHQVLALLDAAQLVRWENSWLGPQFILQENALVAWQAAHDHHLHTSTAMETCLRCHFSLVEASSVPYLYRYVCALLEDNAVGSEIALRIIDLEKRFAFLGKVPLIGQRFVATRVA